jgi:hypothetical protein
VKRHVALFHPRTSLHWELDHWAARLRRWTARLLILPILRRPESRL